MLAGEMLGSKRRCRPRSPATAKPAAAGESKGNLADRIRALQIEGFAVSATPN